MNGRRGGPEETDAEAGAEEGVVGAGGGGEEVALLYHLFGEELREGAEADDADLHRSYHEESDQRRRCGGDDKYMLVGSRSQFLGNDAPIYILANV